MKNGLNKIILGLSFAAATILGGCASNNGLGKSPQVASKHDTTCGGQTQPKTEHSKKGQSRINPVYKAAAKATSKKVKQHKKSAKKQQGNPGFGNKKGFPWIF